MRLNRCLWVLLPIALVACKEDGPPAAPAPPTGTLPHIFIAPTSGVATVMPSAIASAEAPAPADRKMGGRHGRGPVGVMLHAARELDLKDAQKATLDKLEQALHADDGAPKPEFKDFHASLVAGVRAGKIDTAKLEPGYAAIEKAMKARTDKDADALNGLYAALEPAQRKAVTAAARAKQAEREAKHAEHKADAPKPDADFAKRRLERMTKELDLDAAQQKSVEALLAKDPPPKAAMEAMQAEMKKRMDALLTAFEGDGFDAKKLDLAPMPGKKMREGMEHHVQFMSQLLPILKPEQREKLAVKMETPPARHGAGGPGDHEDEPGYGLLFDEPHGEEGPEK